MTQNKPKVLLAMSGGVDSSVAAALLREDGYEVVGCFMRLGSPGESLEAEACEPSAARIGKQGCCSINDAKDAQAVAARLDIPLYVLNFKKDFGRVIDYFVDEYHAGRTPNPCVRCNDWLKFGRLADHARDMGAQYVASGHYARVETIDGSPALLRGVDALKDQSYVLFGASRDSLAHTLLPVGRYRKDEIRDIAREQNLLVADKPDSQEICFVPDGDYAGLLARRDPASLKPGAIINAEGEKVGEHAGQQHFTIGQRRGVGVAFGHPIYVVDKDPQANTVTVGPHEALAATGLSADGVNWLVDRPADEITCTVKIRYNARPVPARLKALDASSLEVTFDAPQHAVAPGQAVVAYEGDRVLAGGWIQAARK